MKGFGELTTAVQRIVFMRFAFVVLAAVVALAGNAAASINVPWFGQKTLSDCGRAVLAALAGRNGSPGAAYDRLPAPADPRGYSISDMQRLGPRVGVHLSLRSPAGMVIVGDCAPRPAVEKHLDGLAATVRAGRPVVVPVSSGFGAGHYLILVGASDEGFTVHDPARQGRYTLSVSALRDRMCNYGYSALIAR